MSRTSKIKNDMTMADFFRIDNKMRTQGPKLIDYGFGDGIGPMLGVGNFDQYSRNLYKQKEFGSVYLGKGIDIDKVPMSISDQTAQFDLGDTPILLINMNNIIKDTLITVKWMSVYNKVIILESYYHIPSPYAIGLSWWDVYSSYFIGPKLEREGKYTVMLEVDSMKLRQDLLRDLIFSMVFTASYNNSSNVNTSTDTSISNSTSDNR